MWYYIDAQDSWILIPYLLIKQKWPILYDILSPIYTLPTRDVAVITKKVSGKVKLFVD